MAVTLGKDVVATYTGIANADIRNVTTTDEAETIDVTARGSKSGSTHYKEYDVGFTNKTVEIECLAHSLAVGDPVGALEVTNITVNEPLDDVVTYNITLKPRD